ncbi:MAG: RHS repeat-associated core domain-containing protein [Planctomycetota bacterium]
MATFTVNDTVPLRIVHHIPAGDVAGTVDHVDVIFNEPIDRLSFTGSDAKLATPSGAIVTPTSVAPVTDTRYRVSFSPQTNFGEYHLAVGPNIRDRAGNTMDQDGNAVPGESTDVYQADFSLVDVDLQIADVTVDAATLWAGEPITVSWDGANYTAYELLGDWTDAVFLSVDDQWDIGDKLLATVPHSGGLAEGETYHQSVEVLVPGRLPRDYYIIVRADLYNQEDEGIAEGNNVVAAGPIPIDVRQLPTDGTPVSGLLSATDRSDYRAIHVDAGESLIVTLDGHAATGANELYVGFETIPTRLSYDCKVATGGQDSELAIPGVVGGGTFYVLVYAAQLDTATSYDISAEAAEVFLSDITPRRHGNLTPGTFTLTGLGFDETTSVVLVGTDMSEWLPTAVHAQSSTVMMVDLDLPAWPADVYDVRVSKPSGASEELVDIVTIVEGGLSRLETNLIVPNRLGFHIAATIWIEYANTGDVPMAAPLLKLYATQDALLSADPALAGPGLWTADPPEGLTDTVLGLGSSATPGILQPGESGRIPVYYRGLKLPWDWSRPPIQFTLGALTADDTTPIDWAGIKDELRPGWMPSDGWDAIVENLADPSFIGDTWGDYVTMLADNVDYLHSVGQEVTDIGSLRNFEIMQAAARFTGGVLADTVDAYSPAPGMPLVFSRSFGECVAKRYALGPLGQGWTHNWDIRGEGSFTLPGGTVWQFRPDGLLDFVEDTNANRITLGYASGRLTSVTHSNGDQLLLDYNADGRIWHVTDPRGSGPEDDHVTTFEYDPSGEYLLKVTAPGDRVTRYTYEPAGTPQQTHTLLSVEYPDGTHEYFSYDDHGRLIKTCVDGGAETVTYDYDSAGTVTVEDATGRETAACFDVGGRLVGVRDGEGNGVSLSYDDYQLIGITGGSGEQYRYSHDSQGNLAYVLDPLRNHTAFTYAPTINKPESVTDARGNRTLYDYEAATGNLLSITYEDGTNESFTYYPDGNLENWTNRRGDTVTYTYWFDGQLKSKDYSTTPDIDYEYTCDDAGNLRSASGPEGTTVFDYYADTDWLKRVDYAGGQFLEFDYWPSGMRKKRTDQDGNVVNYIPDSVGRLHQITDGAGALIVEYEYDPAGRLQQKTLGNGVCTTYEYDDAGRLTDRVNSNPQNAIISSFHYTYDASGSRNSMTVTRNPATPWDGTYRYGYDPLGQLTSVTYPDGRIVGYEYDALGNRLRVVDDGVTTEYITNEMNQYTDVGGVTYGYDDDGNMISRTEGGSTTTYAYDIENRLIEVATPTDTWTYTYDALGNRVTSTRTSLTTTYLVDPIGFGDLAAEYDGSGGLIARYQHGLGLVSRTDADGDSAFYTFSAIGNTSELTDQDGNILNSYSYDPFGVPLSKTELLAGNPFQFGSGYGVTQEANGLEFMRARFYDAVTGGFISEEPLLMPGRNSFSYAENSPVLYVDPTGLASTESDWWTGEGGGVSGFTFVWGKSYWEGFVRNERTGELCHIRVECLQVGVGLSGGLSGGAQRSKGPREGKDLGGTSEGFLQALAPLMLEGRFRTATVSQRTPGAFPLGRRGLARPLAISGASRR